MSTYAFASVTPCDLSFSSASLDESFACGMMRASFVVASHDLDCPPSTNGALLRELEAVYERLLSRAFKLEGEADRARDLVQDTYERALAHIGSFSQDSNLERWMGRIMHNLFVSRCRYRAVRRADYDVNVDALASPCPEPVAVWRQVSGEELAVALRQLKPPFRDVAALHWVERLPYKEVGERLGISIQTVGTRLYRARGALKVLLANPAEEVLSQSA